MRMSNEKQFSPIISPPKTIFAIVIIILMMIMFVEISSDLIEQNKLICSPKNRHLFGKFLLKCWENARTELGLSNPLDTTNLRTDRNRYDYKLEVEKIILRFFNFNAGASIYYKNRQPIPYVLLYRCAETSIMETLHIISRYPKHHDSELKFYTAAIQTAKTQSQLHLLLAANPSSSSNTSYEAIKSTPPIFTFVSDPLERFVSGYQDSVGRLYFKSQSDAKTNMTEIKQKLKLLLHHLQPLPATHENLYPMSGAFFSFGIDIIGRTEDLVDDWNDKICPTYGLNCIKRDTRGNGLASQTTTASNHEIRSKPLPIDIHAVRPALNSLFSQEPKYLTAICYLLLVDYVCLPMYALPKGCQHLQKAREAAQTALNKGRDIPTP